MRWARLFVVFCGVLQGRRGDAFCWARLRRLLPRVFPMPPRRCFPLGSSEAAFCGVLQSRRGDASRWARLRRLSAGFCGVAEALLPVGLVRGGLLRGYAGPTRRCFPMGSSEAASHGIFQRRHCAQRRRSLLSFSPPPPGERMPRTVAPSIQTAKTTPLPFPMLPGDGRAHANRRAVPSISSLFRAHPALPGGGHARLIPPAPARGCSCSRLLPPHLSFDFRPALPSAQPTPVRASLPRRFLRFRAALFPAAARCIRPCSCAGGRIAPFFRLFPRAPRAFLALRSLWARPVRIASRRGKL